jgi:hypothetical protein
MPLANREKEGGIQRIGSKTIIAVNLEFITSTK